MKDQFNIFIDTNIFLSFYEFTQDDLRELEKLVQYQKTRTLQLWLPCQVIDEFNRQRAGVIKKSLEDLQKKNLDVKFPKICEGYDEYDKLIKSRNEYNRIHSDLLQRITNDISSRQLKADKVIDEIFNNSKILEMEGDILENAQRRVLLGNPPGTSNNLGDAIIWETLLHYFPKGDNLHFISNDSGYLSPLRKEGEDMLNEFLVKEWREKKEAKIHFYTNLTMFLKGRLEISLKNEEEAEKNRLIDELFNSSSFRTTHNIISQLDRFDDFTHEQTDRILTAYLSNTQVKWIITDPDVKSFFEKVTRGKENALDPDKLRQIRKLIIEEGAKQKPTEDGETP